MRRATAAKHRSKAGDELPQTMQQHQQRSQTHRRKRRRSFRRKFIPWFRAVMAFVQKDQSKFLGLAVAGTLAISVLLYMLLSSSGYSSPLSSLNIGGADIPIHLTKQYSSVILPLRRHVSPSILEPKPLDEESQSADYGEVHVRFLEDVEERMNPRPVYHDFHEDVGFDPDYEPSDQDDNVDYYYNFDDDAKRNPLVAWDDPDIHNQKQCRRTNWHRSLFINCNSAHEFDLQFLVQKGQSKHVGEGAYRQVFLSEMETETVVFKKFYLDIENDLSDFEFMRMDAIVAERVNWSPKIVHIYGFCALSAIFEGMPHGDIEGLAVPIGGREEVTLNDKEDVDPKNNLTVTEKLTYALDMAESVLLLHSYPDGVIVHDDIQLVQFLLTGDGHVKLNDFNRAEIMFWNEKDQEYCGYRNTPGHGDWRSPEEYYDKPLNEKIDIWSLGNNFYSLLTGVYPFYDELDGGEVKKMIKKGKTGFIDPRYRDRSIEEKALADIIKECWIYDPEKRIDIFEMVRRLRAAAKKVGIPLS